MGLALLLFFTVKEPIKVKPQGLEADRSMMSAVSGIVRLPSFFLIALGVGFAAIPGYGLGVWSPSFLVRVHGMSLVDAGLWLGIIGLSGGTVGTIVSGVLADRLALRDNRWQLWIPAVGLMVALPLQALFLLWPASAVFTIAGKTAPVALVFMGLSSVFACFWIAPSYAAVQNLVPSHWRTQASALLLLVFNLLGLGLGPLLVGMLSDELASFGAASVRWALLSSLSMGYVAITCYWFGAAKYRSAVD